jgi:tetratricopeptide (TPR) repeat protein
MIFDGAEFGPYDRAERNARKAFELYEDGKMTQALSELDQALEINPTNSAWHFNKGLTLDAINRFEEAIAEYETALQLSPSDLEILNALAVDYTRTGLYDRALSTFEDIEQQDPKFEPCYCNRIITYAEMGQHDLAEQMFYLAQQIESDCPLCYYNIGNSLFARGQYKKAVRCWLRTAELEPTHPQIHYRIAQAFWSDGDQDRAREHFMTELRANPADVEVIMDLALFLLELGDVESAREKFHRILEFDADFAPALFYLGEMHFDRGEIDRAVELFQQAMEKDATLPGPHYRLAQQALSSHRTGDARAYLLTELDLDVDDSNTLTSMGSMFLTLGDPDHATQCLLRATGIDKHNADAYHYLGIAAANKGYYEDSTRFFGRAIELNAVHAGALKGAALAHLAAGNTLKAAEQITQARAALPEDSEARAIDYGIRLTRLTDSLGRLLGRLDPRKLLRR